MKVTKERLLGLAIALVGTIAAAYCVISVSTSFYNAGRQKAALNVSQEEGPESPPQPSVVRAAPALKSRDDRLKEYIAVANRAVEGSPEKRRAAVDKLKEFRQQDWDLLIEAGNAAYAPAAELVGAILAEEGAPVVERLARKVAEPKLNPLVPCHVIQKLGGAAAVGVWKHASSSSPQVRFWVASCLSYYPMASPGMLPALQHLIADPDARIAARALQAVSGIGHRASPELTEQVRKAMHDSRAAVRNEAIMAWSMIQARTDADAELVREVCSTDTPRGKRLLLIDAISRRKHTPEVVEALGVCLMDADPQIQVKTLFALQALNQGVTPLASRLVELAKNGKPDRNVNMTLNILSRCKPMPKEAEPVAAKYLQSQQLVERCGAAACLANAENLEPDTIALLLRSLNDKDVSIRANAVQALGHYTDRKDVMQAVRKLSSEDPHPHIRARALEVLKKSQEK
jgi:hypothetical protein